MQVPVPRTLILNVSPWPPRLPSVRAAPGEGQGSACGSVSETAARAQGHSPGQALAEPRLPSIRSRWAGRDPACRDPCSGTAALPSWYKASNGLQRLCRVCAVWAGQSGPCEL